MNMLRIKYFLMKVCESQKITHMYKSYKIYYRTNILYSVFERLRSAGSDQFGGVGVFSHILTVYTVHDVCDVLFQQVQIG